MFKEIMSDLYVRVVKAYKYTLLGIGLVAADVVVQHLASVNNPIVHAVVGLLGTVLVFYKGQYPAPPAK